jgi:C4-dicarboxylate transporter DctM subunit
MSIETTGLAGIVLLLMLFLLRVQVAFAMAIVGFIGIVYLAGIEPALTLLAQDIYESFTSYP